MFQQSQFVTLTDNVSWVEVGSEMYATPESVEAPLPVPPPHNHSVEPLEYKVRAQHRSHRLQGLHPYVYVGLSHGS